MKSLKWNSWNFYYNEKKSDSIEIFQMFQIINSGVRQKVFQYKGKKVISNSAATKKLTSSLMNDGLRSCEHFFLS